VTSGLPNPWVIGSRRRARDTNAVIVPGVDGVLIVASRSNTRSRGLIVRKTVRCANERCLTTVRQVVQVATV
jgi:hypothetical protein